MINVAYLDEKESDDPSIGHGCGSFEVS